MNLTEQEKEEGSKLCWFKPQKALEYISNCYNDLKPSKYDNLYSTKFVIKRDESILKYFIDNK